MEQTPMAERNLNNKTYQQIKQMMLHYEIIPGQRLTFTDLADKLGVSRTPVNNALTLLAKEGYLDFSPNQGYTVHQLTREEADALYEIREILEIGAVDKAVVNATPAKLKELERRQNIFKQAVDKKVGRGRFTIDQEFHAYIVEMSGNQYLAEYFREVYQRIFLRHRTSPLRGDRAITAPNEHQDVIEAFRQGDAEKAKTSLKNHIQAGKDYIYSFIFD
jgi:DNA-binding GntR family transcriptional regulator